MNIRFAPDSVRMRINLEEALTLRHARVMSQDIPLTQGGFTIELLLIGEQEEPVKFTFDDGRAQTAIREGALIKLLDERPSRESSLRAVLPSSTDAAIEFVFEIDLFSRKGKKETSHDRQ